MSRLTISFMVALVVAAVSGGEMMRSLEALRDGGSSGDAVVAAFSGVALFVSLIILSRIAVVTSRSESKGPLRKSGWRST